MAENQDGVVQLVDAGVPADQGLSSLGLIMQLGGHVFAAIASMLAIYSLAAFRGFLASEAAFMFLLCGLAVARSLVHVKAGSQLLYGNGALQEEGSVERMAGLRKYIGFALVQTLVTAGVMVGKYHAPMKIAAYFAAALALWPVALLVLTQLPRFKRFAKDLPLPEDKGFEGASILMTVLGACGVIGGGTILVILLDLPGRALSKGPGVFMILTLGMLVVRSILHVQAGISGLRETSVDRSVELAARYSNFGVISSFCAGGAFLMFAMWGGMNIFAMAFVCGGCWMLMAWPMVVRRFFSDRQFADLLAGDGAPVHRRAADAGLTSLGWLLFSYSILSGSLVLLAMAPGSMMRSLDAITAMSGGSGIRSMWWGVGVLVFQGWAGFELVRMSPQSRVIATLYGVVGTAVQLYISWPMFKAMKLLGLSNGASQLGGFLPLAMGLLLPVATIVLVNRKIAPTARARYRTKPVAPQTPSA